MPQSPQTINDVVSQANLQSEVLLTLWVTPHYWQGLLDSRTFVRRVGVGVSLLGSEETRHLIQTKSSSALC